jgi:hypothetical protein
MTTKPVWITDTFLGTLTENTLASVALYATGTAVSYALISGTIPSRLTLSTSTGLISGTVAYVYSNVNYEFVVRAKNSIGVSDKTFYFDVINTIGPTWITPSGLLDVGPLGEDYIINKQYIDYQLSASLDVDTVDLTYYIEDGDGQLPPGVELDKNGKLSGFVRDQVIVDTAFSLVAKYDAEPYERNPYDYLTFYNSEGKIQYYDKVYQFYVTATDGNISSRRLFQINVRDPESLSFPEIDPDVFLPYTRFVRKPVVPQWLVDKNLGVIRSNNRHVFELPVYDPYPSRGVLRYSLVGSLPENFTFNTATSVLYADIPYRGYFSEDIEITINAEKSLRTYEYIETTSTTATFTFSILGDNAEYISFNNSSNLGTLFAGEVSEIALTVSRNDSMSTTYRVISGSLPEGLSLATDGTIIGKVSYSSTVTNYTFEVRAEDAGRQTFTEKTFSLSVNRVDETAYTNVYLRPFLSETKREIYKEFVSNSNIFDSSIIYRPLDSNFGVQKDIKLVLYNGIEQTSLNNYAQVLDKYFYSKKLLFGDIKIAQGRNIQGQLIYELIYVEIISNLSNNQGQSIGLSVEFSNTTVYPNSLQNMRYGLEDILISSRKIKTTERYLPLYQKTLMNSYTADQKYLWAVPIAYVKPGYGEKTLELIKEYNFDYSSIFFDVDRIIIENSTDSQDDKYLIINNTKT